MRELLWQIDEANKVKYTWNVCGYVDKERAIQSKNADICVGDTYCPYLGDDDYLLSRKQETNVVVSVGEPCLRRKIVKKLRENPNIKFPSIMLNRAMVCKDIKMGVGCILSMDCRVSTNVVLGDFVFLNIGTLVCHDGKVEDFTTLSPDVKIAGQVSIGKQCEIGMGTKIIQGITIGDNTVVGAGSILVRDIEGNCTVAGVPARRIK